MIYILIILWRIVLLFYYLVVDSIYFLIFFEARFLKKVYWTITRDDAIYVPTRVVSTQETEYKNIYHYLLRHIKL